MNGEIRFYSGYMGYLRKTSTGGFVISIRDFCALENLLMMTPDITLTVGDEQIKYGEFKDKVLSKVRSVVMSNECVADLTQPERANLPPRAGNCKEEKYDDPPF